MTTQNPDWGFTAIENEMRDGRERAQGMIKTALLIGLGAYFAYNIISGNLANYINASFAWLSYVAAALFILIGAFSLINTLRPRTITFGMAYTPAHDRAPLSWGAIAIIAVPLVLGTLIPSRPLGVEAVESGTLLTGGASATASDFQINPQDRNVLDWLRVFNNTSDYAEINGQPADVTGFVYSEPTFAPDQFMIARFTVSCCVADASAIGVPVTWADTASLTQGDWVRVQGTMQVGEFRGDSLPIVQATTIEAVEQPNHPYLYP